MAVDIAALQILKVEMSTAIDHLVDVARKDAKSMPVMVKSQQEIARLSAQITSHVTSPSFTNLTLAFEPLRLMTVRIGISLNLFDLVDGPTTFDQLVESTNAEPTFLFRILRALTAFEYFKQHSVNEYNPTLLSRNLTLPPIKALLRTRWDDSVPCQSQYLEFLENRQYQNSGTPSDNIIKQVYGKDNYFDFLASNPERLASFDTAMSIQELFPRFMMPDYPFPKYESELKASVDENSDAVAVVDIGGGYGQVLQGIRREHPDLPGRLILQDLEGTIGKAREKDSVQEAAIELMIHDFFTPQPIQGAKFYHLRRVLHDWQDDDCVRILSSVHGAMVDTPKYSTLLIHEAVLPDMNVSPMEAAMDLNMMTILCGMERSKTQWEQLLNRSGFEMTEIYRAQAGGTCVIEAKVRIG